MIDLGVMIPPDKILTVAREESADIVGLSGLITPSLDEMVHVAKELERDGFDIPLLIGGATTSRKHTAIKIENNYSGATVHVIDASRAAGVVSSLLNEEQRDEFIADTHEDFKKIRESHEANLQRKAVITLDEARDRKPFIDWKTYESPKPNFQGIKVFNNYPLDELADYIDWSPFFHTWEIKGKFPTILDSSKYGEESIQ